MCSGFGMIVTSELKGYFVEPDNRGDVSHTDILNCLGWKDNENQFTRRFVRVECADWTTGSFRFDEDETLPGWVEEHRDEIITLVDKILTRAAPAWAEYQKVSDHALAEYEKGRAPALAEYHKVRAQAWDEFTRTLSSITGYVAPK